MWSILYFFENFQGQCAWNLPLLMLHPSKSKSKFWENLMHSLLRCMFSHFSHISIALKCAPRWERSKLDPICKLPRAKVLDFAFFWVQFSTFFHDLHQPTQNRSKLENVHLGKGGGVLMLFWNFQEQRILVFYVPQYPCCTSLIKICHFSSTQPCWALTFSFWGLKHQQFAPREGMSNFEENWKVPSLNLLLFKAPLEGIFTFCIKFVQKTSSFLCRHNPSPFQSIKTIKTYFSLVGSIFNSFHKVPSPNMHYFELLTISCYQTLNLPWNHIL